MGAPYAHASVAELQQLIDSDPVVHQHLTLMLEEAKDVPIANYTSPENVTQMLAMMDETLSMAPTYDESCLVGFPMNAFLDRAMATPHGYAAFRDSKLQKVFEKMLNEWGAFLDSPASRYVLHDGPGGWQSPEAKEKLDIHLYQHSPEEQYWGFKSWNDFFTRKLAPGKLQISSPEDDKVAVSAAEATKFALKENVQADAPFWVKDESYSLRYMFADPIWPEFVNGTVYQAFLSAFNYHRWHAPISGTIVVLKRVPGLYYSQIEDAGPDECAPDLSQTYIAHTNARTVFVIQSDNPAVGKVGVVWIGMAECSSGRIKQGIRVGSRVEKGDEIGHFAFGGSTHTVVFQADKIDRFAEKATKGEKMKVGEPLAYFK